MPKTPAYRQRKGHDQALVTLTDAVTKRRSDFWLGPHGSPASRELYHRVIAQWEAAGRKLSTLAGTDVSPRTEAGPKVKEIVHQYWAWAKGYYRPKHMQALHGALRLLRKYYGELPASDFGPKKLRLLRDEMIRGDEADRPPRKPWSRKYINSQIQRIRHVFKWAAGHELAPASVHQALSTLEPLKRGRCNAREGGKVLPVPDALLNSVRPHLCRPIRALVELQLLTAARPGELLGLRPLDIEVDERTQVWTFRPDQHKNTFREHDRVIYFGPRAQEIVRPFMLDRPTTAFCFSPLDADQERRDKLHAVRSTPLSCGNRPGTNRRDTPRRKPGDRYLTPAYHRAIEYACDRAFLPPTPLARERGETRATWRKRLTPKQREELRAWQRDHRFHPHQLRHNAATYLRREYGLEAAQLTLGHASAQITDAVYAERDHAKVIEIMRKIG